MSINDLVFKDEVEEQIPADGVLPELGTYLPPLPPNKEYMVRIPDDVGSLIELKDVTQDNVTRQRVFLKFSREHPLLVVGGDFDGHPLTGSFSNIPRARGRDKIAVSDLAYYLIDGCKINVAPKTPKEWVEALARTSGLLVKILSGRTGQCRPDKDVYVASTIVDPETQQQSTTYSEVVGMKGCGKRYYTRDFLLPGGGYTERITCSGKRKYTDTATETVTEVACGASIRGFDGVDRWVK